MLSSCHFFTAHSIGTCTHTYTITQVMRKPAHFHQLGLNSLFNPHQNVGWLQPGFDSDSLKESSVRTHATRDQPEFNPSSTRVKVAVRMCLYLESTFSLLSYLGVDIFVNKSSTVMLVNLRPEPIA